MRYSNAPISIDGIKSPRQIRQGEKPVAYLVTVLVLRFQIATQRGSGCL